MRLHELSAEAPRWGTRCTYLISNRFRVLRLFVRLGFAVPVGRARGLIGRWLVTFLTVTLPHGSAASALHGKTSRTFLLWVFRWSWMPIDVDGRRLNIPVGRLSSSIDGYSNFFR